jgi:hypothetical protein
MQEVDPSYLNRTKKNVVFLLSSARVILEN